MIQILSSVAPAFDKQASTIPQWTIVFRRFFACSVGVGAILSICIVARHGKRGSELTPLLDAIASSKVCFHSQTQTCAVELPPDAVRRFDLHEAENPLFGFLYSQVVNKDPSEMAEILKGAHVQLRDDDLSAYEFLRTLPGSRARISSHRSDVEQYGIPEGRVVSSLLVGALSNATWFQLEASPWDPRHNFRGSLGHCLDFLEYRITGRNVGPLGTSKATDRRSLVKDTIIPASQACPEACPAPSTAKALLQVRRLLPGGSKTTSSLASVATHVMTNRAMPPAVKLAPVAQLAPALAATLPADPDDETAADAAVPNVERRRQKRRTAEANMWLAPG